MFLDNYYEIVNSTKLNPNGFSNKIDKKCRFCGRSNDEVSFNNKPHIIPELLGRNGYVSNDECDVCNCSFGEFEHHLGLFVQPYLTFCGIKTKKRVPGFRSRKDDKTNFTRIHKDSDVIRADFGKNLTDFNMDKEIGRLFINLRKQPYIPLSVYKALLKIGLSLMPEKEIENCSEIIKWLKGETKVITCFPELIRTRLTKKFTKPFVSLYKARNIHLNGKEYPEYVLLIGTANLVFQIYLPLTKNNFRYHKKESKLVLEYFPASVWNGDYTKIDNNKVKLDYSFKRYDLSISDEVFEDDTIRLSITSPLTTPPPRPRFSNSVNEDEKGNKNKT
jgi:hypothetical protein